MYLDLHGFIYSSGGTMKMGFLDGAFEEAGENFFKSFEGSQALRT